MATLDELLLQAKRADVITDCVGLIDDEVSQKGGLAGMAVKGAYAIVKKVKPGIIREAVDRLLNEFVGKLEPYFADFQNSSGNDFASFLVSRKNEVASALLGVTDARAKRADNRTIKKAYDKLRPSGMKHVEAAVPGVGRVINRYL